MKKLLKTKNFLIGFIMVMISIIPISNVKASDTVSVSYGSKSWTFNNPEYYGYKYGMFIYKTSSSTNQYYFLSNEPLAYSTSYVVVNIYDDITTSDYKYKSGTINTSLTIDNFSSRSSNYGLNTSAYTILWSNYDVPEVSRTVTTDPYTSTGNISHACNADNCVDAVKNIEIEATKATEISTGLDIYNIRVDFEQVYNSTYTYQIKTDYTDWVDITSNIADAVSYGYYYYDYMMRYNSNFYARALDSNGDVVTETSITISDLNDFGITIDRYGYGDTQGRELAQFIINFQNCWDESYTYQYSFNNVDFVDMEAGEERKYKLYQGINTDIYFRILDSSGNVIYTLKDEKLTKYGNYSWLYDVIERNVIIKEDTNINDDKEKEIIISVDFSEFSQFSDMYDLKFYIDDKLIDGDNKTLIYTEENFVTGFYIKIELDGIELKNYGHRIAASGSGGGSDSGFNDTYDNVIDNNLSAELGEQDYTSVEGLFDVVKNFINAVSSYIIIFFDLIMYFFNGLNPWLRNAIISLFVVLVISKIIKVVRR